MQGSACTDSSAAKRLQVVPGGAQECSKAEHSSCCSSHVEKCPRSILVVSCLEGRNVELGHFQHRLHRPVRPDRIAPADQVPELRGNDLPRQAEPILQP